MTGFEPAAVPAALTDRAVLAVVTEDPSLFPTAFDTAQRPMAQAVLAYAAAHPEVLIGTLEAREQRRAGRIAEASTRAPDAPARLAARPDSPLRRGRRAKLPTTWVHALRPTTFLMGATSAAFAIEGAESQHWKFLPVAATLAGFTVWAARRDQQTVKPGMLCRAQPVVARLPIASTLIAINIAVFAAIAIQARSTWPTRMLGTGLFQRLALMPHTSEQNRWATLITSGFVHVGLVHLLFDMFGLAVLASVAEPLLGHGKFLAIYLSALLGGSLLADTAPSASHFVAGSSGAICGIVGALLVVALRHRANPSGLLATTAVVLASTLPMPHATWWSHLGGFVIGAAAATLLYRHRAR